MDVVLLVIFYLWIVWIHSLFVGLSGFALFGKHLSKFSKWQVILIFILPLSFFEFYWVPVFKYFDISLFIGNKDILSWFEMDGNTDVVTAFKLAWFQPLFLLIGGWFAYWVGNRFYSKRVGV